MNEGFDELVQIDEDLMHWERYLPRLMSHDVDIVAAVRARVLEWLDDLGITIPKDRLVCSL